MKQKDYHALIDDTLTHIRALLPPQKKEIKVELPSPPAPKPKPRPQPVTPPPPIEKPQEKPTTSTFFELKPPPTPPQEPTLGIQNVLKELDPNLYLHETVPSDHKAKRIKNSWREKRDTPTIPILFQGQPYRSFIARIAKAIDTLYHPCRIVEVEPQKKWDLFLESENLKLIIVPDALLFSTPQLLPFYQENPQQKTRLLGKVPLLLLPDLSLYFKDPYLKRALWNVITTTIQNQNATK